MDGEIRELSKPSRYTSLYETQQLEKRLKEFVKEENYEATLEYKDLCTITGRNVAGTKGLLQTARKNVEKETGKLFATVRNVGIKLANIKEQCSISTDAIKVVRNRCRTAVRRMAFVEYDKMTNEQKVSHNVGASLLGAVSMFVQSSAVRRLEDKKPEAKPLDFGETLKLFQS